MNLLSRPIVTLFAVVLGLAAGCKTPPKPGKEPPASLSLSNFADCQQIGTDYVPAERQATQTLNAALCTGPYKPNPNKAPINVLSLSAGGKYAAYCGGVIVGWGEHGTRPKFDVVAGMSGGALIAVHALLGEKYDHVIRRQFTTLKSDDFFKFKPAYYLLTNRTLGTAAPLKKLIDREIHAEVVSDLAAAHAEGRRCLVGTMNLHTRRLAVWDLTAIAASDRCDRGELIKKILLASGSIPGLVDPVEFDVTVNGCRYVEQHCDGGAVCQGFFRLTADQAPDGRLPVPPASNLYCMGAGKIYCDPLVGELGFVGKIRSATSGTLYAMYRGDLYRMYTVAVAAGLKFHLCAIPQDFEIKPESMKIDEDDLRKLFNLGYCEGRNGCKWRYQPPGSEPGEEEMPRTGTDYYVDNNVRGDLFPQVPVPMAEPPRKLPETPARQWMMQFPIFHSAVAK